MGGGRFAGYPTAALLAGASCVLSSTMVLFDRQDAVFCEMLHNQLLEQPTRTIAEVLLDTRRRAAEHYDGHPAVWAQYALWGNPDARLLAS